VRSDADAGPEEVVERPLLRLQGGARGARRGGLLAEGGVERLRLLGGVGLTPGEGEGDTGEGGEAEDGDADGAAEPGADTRADPSDGGADPGEAPRRRRRRPRARGADEPDRADGARGVGGGRRGARPLCGLHREELGGEAGDRPVELCVREGGDEDGRGDGARGDRPECRRDELDGGGHRLRRGTHRTEHVDGGLAEGLRRGDGLWVGEEAEDAVGDALHALAEPRAGADPVEPGGQLIGEGRHRRCGGVAKLEPEVAGGVPGPLEAPPGAPLDLRE
jgi:hypothetical protein